MKLCSMCKERKPFAEFWKHKRYLDGLQPSCKECWKKYQGSPERKVRNNAQRMISRRTPKRREYEVAYRLKKKFGLTVEGYQNLLKAQGNRCAICSKLDSDSQNGLYVDHDHVTNKVRGLLCRECNSGLGFFDDRVENLIRAEMYLSKNLED